jgi:hypothetical protein
VTFHLALNVAGRATATVDRAPARGKLKYRRVGTLAFAGLSPQSRSFAPKRTREGRKLTPGRYRVKLRIAGAAAAGRTLTFRLR